MDSNFEILDSNFYILDTRISKFSSFWVSSKLEYSILEYETQVWLVGISAFRRKSRPARLNFWVSKLLGGGESHGISLLKDPISTTNLKRLFFTTPLCEQHKNLFPHHQKLLFFWMLRKKYINPYVVDIAPYALDSHLYLNWIKNFTDSIESMNANFAD